jgi:dephospho-CoA kinase
VLRVGLSGGIGSGKSAVSSRLRERGAVVVDADALAREVVAPGTPGLAAVVGEFGTGLLLPDGSLDRPALGQRVFADPEARRRLEGIVHPLVGQRTAELITAAPPGAVVVHDVPLLVEKRMGAAYHLVVIVAAPAGTRVARLVGLRGMAEADARARIGAQADDAARRAAADVWLDNSGDLTSLGDRVDALWRERLLPYEENIRLRRPAAAPAEPGPYDPAWPAEAARLGARLALVTGGSVRHVGPTAVPGEAAPDVLDLELTVPASGAGDVDAALADAGFPAAGERLHGSADPARPARVHLTR